MCVIKTLQQSLTLPEESFLSQLFVLDQTMLLESEHPLVIHSGNIILHRKI